MYTVLICEDEQEIRTLIAEHLECNGFTVYSTADGLTAIDMFKLKQSTIDCVLLDVMVPNLSGFEVLKLIRQISNVPVIMLTAMAEEHDKIKGLTLGADDYIAKPFSFAEMVVRLKAQIRRNTQYAEKMNQSAIITNGALSFDTVKLEAYKHGEALTLYAKELKLFRLFMENQNKIFTRKQIYETIWQDIYQDDANTIMVHIYNLRDKIEDNPKNPKYIKTMRGVGYRMEIVDE